MEDLFEKSRGINFVVVDIQPSYKSSIHFLPQFIDFLNNNDFVKVLYLFNGPDLGMESHHDIMYWLLDNGLDEDKIDDLDFFEKNYAFFRGWMDTGVDYDDIVRVGTYMIKNRIWDSRDISEEVFMKMDLEELYEKADPINIPDVVDELQKLKLPLLCGGGRNECLAEVELAMQMINKRYKKLNKFIY